MSVHARIAGSRRILNVFGLPIQDSTLDNTAKTIVDAAEANRDMRVAFINAHCVNQSIKDHRYRTALNRFEALFADGIGMRIAAGSSGLKLADNVNGTDLFPLLCEEAAERGVSIYLLGAKEGRAAEAARRMAAAYPGLKFAGTHHGFFRGDDEEEQIIQDINSSGADILIVALGVPLQEIWIDKYRDRLKPRVVLGVGALLDFYSGSMTRAPLALRKVGLEWAWRLAIEPSRLWKRYVLGNAEFLSRIFRKRTVAAPLRSAGADLEIAAIGAASSAPATVLRISRHVYSDISRVLMVAAATVSSWIALTGYMGDSTTAWSLMPAFAAIFFVLSKRVFPDCARRFVLRDIDKLAACTGAGVIGSGLLVAASGQYQQFTFAALLLWFGAAFLAALVALSATMLFARGRFMMPRLRSRLAIFGAGPLSAKVIEELQFGSVEADFVGLFEDRRADRVPFGGCEPSGNFENLLEAARNGEVDDVVIALPQFASRRMRDCAARLAAYPVNVHVCTHVATDYPSRHISGPKSSMLGDVGLLQLRVRPIADWHAIMKRAEDVVIGSVLLAISLPLLGLIAIAIKLDSPGPILFRQDRTGLNNRRFQVLKFRTMRVMENSETITQAKENDSRVTRVGRYLRKSSLDELPQLWNVVKGEMSLVGPRPHAVAHDIYFASILGRYQNRHQVKPGLTGLAQVSGFRGETPQTRLMLKRLQYDLWYIENWSLLLDLKIILQTPFACLTDKRAY